MVDRRAQLARCRRRLGAHHDVPLCRRRGLRSSHRCANVANLLLAQGLVRRRELAVRAALGASRLHLARGLFAESLLLAVAGGAAGLLLGWWVSRLVVTLAPQGIPRIDQVGLDPTVFAYIAGISLLTTLLVGMAPAIRATRFDLQRALVEGGRTGTSHRTARLAPALIITQIALAVVLVTGAGLSPAAS
jgi:predicted lysophospholipase L1 biosynthesis ABC-type transport system permease subunit